MNKEMLIRSIIILIMVFVVSIVLVKTFTGGQTIEIGRASCRERV